MRKINFADMDAKPEEVEGTIGVSDRFQNEELKQAIMEQLHSEPKDDAGKVEENAEKVNSVLKGIVGGLGEFKLLSRVSLIPTPEEWNQFTPISKERKILMADSIHRIGLQQPIVVRKVNQEGKYEILSGNTRTEIYGILYDITQDEKYLSIPARVYDIGEISDEQALEIASDTNYVQRGNLSSKDKAFAIRTKVTMLKKHGEKGVLDMAAKQMGITKSGIFYWEKMANLIPEFLRMFDEGRIGLKAASRIASWPKEIQEELLEYKDKISDESIMKVKTKTAPESVLENFLAAIEEASSNDSKAPASIESIKATKHNCTIKIDAPPEEGYEVLVMYLPKKKASQARKSYDKYILREVEQEQELNLSKSTV